LKILTFDLEEWFHINNSDWIEVEQWPDLKKRIKDNTNIILSFLRRHHLKASFFVLGWVAEYYPELVKIIADEGHDVGYHSYYHRIPKYQSQKEFEKDLVKGIELLKSITGKEVKYYRAPNFSLKNKWMLDCLIDHGIEVSSSIKNPIKHKGISLPDEPFVFSKGSKQIIELPLETKHFNRLKIVFSGGGYFRILPISVLNKLFAKSEYLMLYFHPNDFDVDHPTRKELGFIRNKLNTIGTKTTLSKLEVLSDQYSFISIGQLLNQMDKNKLPVVSY